jgi:hypothetical protein
MLAVFGTGTTTYTQVLAQGLARNVYGDLGSRSLGKTKMNAVWQVFGVNSIIRWMNTRSCGFFQRMAVDNTWDLFHGLFHGMRDSRRWDNDQDATAGSHWSTQWGVNDTTGMSYQVPTPRVRAHTHTHTHTHTPLCTDSA